MVPLQPSFVNRVKGSVVDDDMHVTTSAIPEVAQVLWVKGTLQCCQVLIRLRPIWMIHLPFLFNLIFIFYF